MRSMISGRVTMSMTSLLTLASMFNSLTQVTPPISYVTKLDIWMVGCIGFVFAILFEFTVVIIIKHLGDGDKANKVGGSNNKGPTKAADNNGQLIRTIEKLSSVGIFVAFALFNAVYWIDIFAVLKSQKKELDGHKFCLQE